MASMRVHELAKEFGLSSKDMLDRIHEMKIPAKSHASVLADAYVAKIRKKMGPVATTVNAGDWNTSSLHQHVGTQRCRHSDDRAPRSGSWL